MRQRSRTQVVFSLTAIPVLVGIACLWATAGVEAIRRTGSSSLPAGSMLEDTRTATPMFGWSPTPTLYRTATPTFGWSPTPTIYRTATPTPTPTWPPISPTPTNTRPYRTRTPTLTRTRPADAWANLSISKELSPPPQGPVAPGTCLTYTLALHNAGPSEASNVVVLDVLPRQVRLTACGFVTGSCNLQWAAGPNGEDLAEFQFGSLPAGSTAWGAVWAQVLTDTCNTVMHNSAEVGSSVPDPDPSDNIANLDTEIGACEGAEADLSVTKGTAAQQPVAPGARIQYDITVRRSGPSGAANVVVVDVLPPSVAYVQGDACWTMIAHRPPNDVLRCELGDLGAWQSSYVTSFEVQVDEDACGRMRNIVEVHSDTADSNPGNNVAWLDTVVGPCRWPAVLVTKRLLDPQGGLAHLGDIVIFEIVVSNIGNSPLEFVSLTEAYDSSVLEFVVASLEPTQVMVGPVQGLLTWADLAAPSPFGFGGPLPPGGSFAVTVRFRAIESGVTQNCAGVVAEAAEGGAADENCAALRVRDPTVDLQVGKRLIQPVTGLAVPGLTVRFEIRLENTGLIPITALGLHDEYDTAYLSFLGADFAPNDPTDDGALDWWNLTAPPPQGFGHALLPGQLVTFEIAFRAGAATPPGQPALNCLLAWYRQGEDAGHETSRHCAPVVIQQQGPTVTPSPTPSPTGEGAIRHIYLPIIVRQFGG